MVDGLQVLLIAHKQMMLLILLLGILSVIMLFIRKNYNNNANHLRARAYRILVRFDPIENKQPYSYIRQKTTSHHDVANLISRIDLDEKQKQIAMDYLNLLAILRKKPELLNDRSIMEQVDYYENYFKNLNTK